MTHMVVLLFALTQGQERPALPSSRLPSVDVLTALAQEALRNSPTLKQIAARIAAARTRATQARAWPDPSVSVTLMNAPFDRPWFDSSPMTGVEIMAMQMFPYQRQLRLGEQMADAQVAALGEKLREARLMLALMVRTMALDLVYHRAMIEVLGRQAKLVERVVELANTRLRVQLGDLAEVLIARQQRAKVDDDVEKINGEREAMEARLNALLARPTMAKVPAVELPAVPAAVPPLADLVQEAYRRRPMIREMEHRRRMELLDRDMRRTERWPMFGMNVGFRYGRELMDGVPKAMFSFTVGLSIRLPLLSRHKTRAAIREAEARAEMEAHAIRTNRLEVERQIRTARDALTRLTTRFTLVETRLLPLARQAMEATLSSYLSGKQSFSTLMDQWRMLYELEVEALRLKVQRSQTWIALRAAAGDGADSVGKPKRHE